MIDDLLNISFTLTTFLGSVQISIKELYELKEGSVIKLNKNIDDLVDIYINDNKIGTAEVLIINSKFAIKINDLNFKEKI